MQLLFRFLLSYYQFKRIFTKTSFSFVFLIGLLNLAIAIKSFLELYKPKKWCFEPQRKFEFDSKAIKDGNYIIFKCNMIMKTNFITKDETINIPQKKIREVIGSRGAVIKEICAVSGALVDIDDTGLIKISSSNADAIKKAISMINEITFEPEIGDIYEGPVVKVIDAGAFISISPNRDGFVHISELAEYRIDFVEDAINEGDIVKVKVIGFDKKGRPKLSYRCVDQTTGEDISDRIANKPAVVDEREFSSRGEGSRDRDDRRDRRDDRRGDDRRDRRDDRRGDRDDRREKRGDESTKKRKGFFS
jgi:predicted RNA-binding protein with RPS1 domain